MQAAAVRAVSDTPRWQQLLLLLKQMEQAGKSTVRRMLWQDLARDWSAWHDLHSELLLTRKPLACAGSCSSGSSAAPPRPCAGGLPDLSSWLDMQSAVRR